jgi:two-component system aerobic respiration control sensor histidine kinase ArcB
MSTQPPAPDSHSAEDRAVVLIVDDYAETRRLLYFYLRNHYEVVAVESAEEALDYLREHRVDLVVMDINFQEGMNGITATEQIRADEKLHHLPVLATSAYAYPDDRARFLKAGFDDYIAKPIFKERMLKKVRALLEGSSGSERGVWISKKDNDDKALGGSDAAGGGATQET